MEIVLALAEELEAPFPAKPRSIYRMIRTSAPGRSDHQRS